MPASRAGPMPVPIRKIQNREVHEVMKRTFQPKERLEEKYDHILEIRIDNARTRKLLSDTEEQLAEVRPEEAFAMFFSEMNGREMTPEERELMRQVIAQEMEGDE